MLEDEKALVRQYGKEKAEKMHRNGSSGLSIEERARQVGLSDEYNIVYRISPGTFTIPIIWSTLPAVERPTSNASSTTKTYAMTSRYRRQSPARGEQHGSSTRCLSEPIVNWRVTGCGASLSSAGCGGSREYWRGKATVIGNNLLPGRERRRS